MRDNERSHPTEPPLGRCSRCTTPLVRTVIVSELHPDRGKTFAACPTHGNAYEIEPRGEEFA